MRDHYQAQAEKVHAIEKGRQVSDVVRLALEVEDSERAAQRLIAARAEEVAPPVITPWAIGTRVYKRRTECS